MERHVWIKKSGQKAINGRIIEGPSFNLIGITSSQISKDYAFITYLSFNINNGLRNLEVIKLPAICQIDEGIKENKTNVNIVDFDCIGNTTIDDNSLLVEVEINGNKLKDEIINDPEKVETTYNSKDRPSVYYSK